MRTVDESGIVSGIVKKDDNYRGYCCHESDCIVVTAFRSSTACYDDAPMFLTCKHERHIIRGNKLPLHTSMIAADVSDIDRFVQFEWFG